ncbi:short-chain alcohol dehydrogenase, partial [Pestalotiopsis sp. IQ-011]
TSALVDKLDAAGAEGTFFFTGTLYGFVAYMDPRESRQSRHFPDTVGDEQAFVNIFGKKPAYMRPLNLATSSNMLSVMSQMGYSVITDDVDAGDGNHQTAQQSEQKFTQAGASGNGHIPLMHETYDSTVNTLVPWLINWAKTNNLKIVTIAECLDDAANMYQPGTFTGNGASSC